MTNFVQRVITGIVLVALIAFLVMWNSYSFLAFLLVLNAAGLAEFYQLFHRYTIAPRSMAGILFSLVLLLALYLLLSGLCDALVLLLFIPLVFAFFVLELYLKAHDPFQRLAIIFLGILFVTVPLCFFLAVAFFPPLTNHYHPRLVMGCFILLWVHDSFAYFTGRSFGRHALFPRISPHKTWEGSLGGLIAAVTAAYGLAYFAPELSAPHWIGLALLMVVSGTFGDLFKSMMKRSLKIKDSGRILPGHGGILDRFDSLLGSAPFVFGYLCLITYA